MYNRIIQKKYNTYNQKSDYTDYTLIIQYIFLCDDTDYIFLKLIILIIQIICDYTDHMDHEV